jgi:hypothetical protein
MLFDTQVMAHYDHARMLAMRARSQFLNCDLPLARVEACRRFVGKNQLTTVGHGPDNRHSLFLSLA